MDLNLSVSGEFNLLEIFTHINVYNCAELKKKLYTLIEKGIGNIAVYLHDNEDHMDSSVISAMISAHKKATALGFKFALIIPNDEIINLLMLAGLDNFFNIYRTVEGLNIENY